MLQSRTASCGLRRVPLFSLVLLVALWGVLVALLAVFARYTRACGLWSPHVALWWTSAPSLVCSRCGWELWVRGLAFYDDTLALHRLHGILGPTVSHHVLTV